VARGFAFFGNAKICVALGAASKNELFKNFFLIRTPSPPAPLFDARALAWRWE
jgi:hypothetical protein